MTLLKKKIARWLSVLAWMVFIFLLSSQPSLKSSFEPTIDFILRKLAHITEYSILTWLVYHALSLDLKTKKALVWALAIALVYALSDEWHQTFVARRSGNFKDVGIDLAGILAAVYWLKTKFFK